MLRLALPTLMLALSVGPVRAADPAGKPKDIDLVICLDVSGSMNGLIDSAKLRLWDIVNELAKVKPTPNLRVGLYSYGATQYPKANGWIRRDVELTTDLDAVYAKLNAFRTDGGEEYVARVSKAALDDLKWSRDEGALRIIFVCGNEPATQDPENTLEAVATSARKAGVIINTIYCGNPDNAEAQGYSRFADMAGGKYASIDQNKAKAATIATPFDRELDTLSTSLNKTYVGYGRGGAEAARNQVAQDANARGAAPAAAASRAESKAGAAYNCAAWDLIDKLKDDPKFDIKTLKDDDLPGEMRSMTHEERLAYLKKKGEERTAIQKKIGELATKRQKHIDEETKKQPKSPGEIALDEAFKKIIRSQAENKGFEVRK